MNNVIHLAIAKKIFDSDKKPALEIELGLSNGKIVTASSGEGESRGRDEGNLENVESAIKNFAILNKIFLELKKIDQKRFDSDLFDLYSAKKIGINTALTASIAHLKARAVFEKKELWQLIQAEYNLSVKSKRPQAICVLAEGGKRSSNSKKLGVQEISIIGMDKAKEAEKALKQMLVKNHIKFCSGLEGGIAPQTDNTQQILSALGGFNLALDIASQTRLLKDDVNLLLENNNIKIVEDPFDQNQTKEWQSLQKQKNILVVADDLTVTRPDLIKKYQNCFNAIIIKPTQAGTVSRTIEAVILAKQLGKKIIVSHRGRETMDDFLADFAIAINSDYVKFGNPSQKQRKVKYDRLEKILAGR